MENSAKVKMVEKYMEAVSTDNINLIKEIYADNATVEDPVGSPVKRGIDEIVAFYSSFSGVKTELIGPVRCAGNAAAFPFRAKMGPVSLEVIDVFEFNDAGKVVSMKAYWSMDNKVEG